MKKSLLLIMAMIVAVFTVKAQDEDSGLKISGSVDTYFKYDFADYSGNGKTSFASDHNSVSIGMVDIALEQTVGKASFVGEISFGPRGQAQSILNAAGNYDEDFNSFNIQNLYVSYALSDVVSLTGGFMGTFVGYEVISPAANFNYSTSHLFSYGPFQNAGIKADFAISDRFAFMVGLFNDWNVYSDFNGVSDFGAQVYVAPVDGWDVYVNFVTGWPSGTELDLTTGYQITDAFYLGLNAATYTQAGDANGGFGGAALYAQYAFSDAASIGVRYENFKDKESFIFGAAEDVSVNAFTFSGNIKSGSLTFIPELRIDTGSADIYMDSDMAATGSATQLILAAVYAF